MDNKAGLPKRPSVFGYSLFLSFFAIVCLFCFVVSLSKIGQDRTSASSICSVLFILMFIICLIGDRVLALFDDIVSVNRQKLEELEKLNRHAKLQSNALKLLASKKEAK